MLLINTNGFFIKRIFSSRQELYLDVCLRKALGCNLNIRKFETTLLKSEKTKIKDLLFSIKADTRLYNRIINDIQSKKIHSNEAINAIKISKKLIEGSLNVCLVAPMQSGKTGSIKYHQ